MASFRFTVTIGILASVCLYTTAGPVNLSPSVAKEPLSEFLDVIPEEEVRTLERFYRVYEDGTIEFKLVLSNGLAQYQKITNKVVNGKTIQVYQGYSSEKLPDESYRTTHYIADENGYRLLRREYDTKPPVLPPYVPHVPQVTTSEK